jgi:hypothetical protein
MDEIESVQGPGDGHRRCRQAVRQQLRQRGRRAQRPKRVWKTQHPRGRPLQQAGPCFPVERPLAWFQRHIGGWSSAGSACRRVSRRC